MMVQGTIEATKELLQRSKTSAFKTENKLVVQDQEDSEDEDENMDKIIGDFQTKEMGRKLTVIPEGTEIRDSYDSVVKGLPKIETDNFSIE
jgi:hypothetical protein